MSTLVPGASVKDKTGSSVTLVEKVLLDAMSIGPNHKVALHLQQMT